MRDRGFSLVEALVGKVERLGKGSSRRAI